MGLRGATWFAVPAAVKLAPHHECGHLPLMLTPMAELVRRHDPDRFLTALFAPPARRETLFTLYAFNHELARAREVVREPMMAMVRWQWWREVVEGARRRHEVAGPLGDALDAGLLRRADLEGMIAGREMEVEFEGAPSLAEWRAYVLATAGGVSVAAAFGLVGPGHPPHPDPLPGGDGGGKGAEPGFNEPVIRALGAAYGAGGLLRAAPILAAQSRSLLPEGGTDAVRTQGLAWLKAGKAPRQLRPAVLVAALARRDLNRSTTPGPRGLGDRLAVVRAALSA